MNLEEPFMLFTEAQQILVNHARSFGTENVPLEQAFDRVLAETVIADRDYPPFHRAAMDGYAFRHADFQQGMREFGIVETIYAGQTPSATIAAGQCYRIMTGAATPAPANVVVRREDAEESHGNVKILTESLQPFQNIARQGEDLQQGARIIEGPAVVTPQVVSLLAAIGKPYVTVSRIPKVSLITTGNEVMPIASAVSAVQIRNSNQWLLRAMLAKQGIAPTYMTHVEDKPDLLKRAFREALDADMLIATGGVSAGDADYVPGVLESLGVKKLFHKVQIRPGKPVWCGRAEQNTLVFALPGNPLSCMVTFMLFVQHYLLACYGLPAPAFVPVTLQQARRKKHPLDEFFPVRVLPGTAEAEALPFNGSGDIRAALHANAMALHPRDQEVLQKGERVFSYPISNPCFIP